MSVMSECDHHKIYVQFITSVGGPGQSLTNTRITPLPKVATEDDERGLQWGRILRGEVYVKERVWRPDLPAPRSHHQPGFARQGGRGGGRPLGNLPKAFRLATRRWISPLNALPTVAHPCR